MTIAQMDNALRTIENNQAIYKAARTLTVVFAQPIELEYETVISIENGVCLCEDEGNRFSAQINDHFEGHEIITLWNAAKAQEAAAQTEVAEVATEAPAKTSARAAIFRKAHANAKKYRAQYASFREAFAAALKMAYAMQRVANAAKAAAKAAK